MLYALCALLFSRTRVTNHLPTGRQANHVVNGNGLFILGKMNDIANCDVKRTV